MAVAANVNAVPGSLAALLDALVVLEGSIDPGLAVYKFRPQIPPELPAIWNWIDASSFEHRDTVRWRDTINVTATIGIRRTDSDTNLDRLMAYADQFRDVVDPAISMRPPFTGSRGTSAATWGQRRGLSLGNTPFAGGVNALCVSFGLTFFLDRQLPR